MSYSRGVLIHNFNEDQYGMDLQSIPRQAPRPAVSVTHQVHHWKQPAREDVLETAATQGVDRHILFGHTGDMRDPHTNLQKTEFATANQYFFQNPAKIAGVGQLTADNFTLSSDPVKVSTMKAPSTIADKRKMGWGDQRQTHAPTADERFMTQSKLTALQGADRSNHQPVERITPQFREFSHAYDAVKLTRTNLRKSDSHLRSAGQLSLGG
mmetsp:Transcript_110870/g.192188  ORF Transcript_110870/g.192188 Transcript_110870/m.192188 type:complete len:211 (-) Transcript_110870:52-684(-)